MAIMDGNSSLGRKNIIRVQFSFIINLSLSLKGSFNNCVTQNYKILTYLPIFVTLYMTKFYFISECLSFCPLSASWRFRRGAFDSVRLPTYEMKKLNTTNVISSHDVHQFWAEKKDINLLFQLDTHDTTSLRF